MKIVLNCYPRLLIIAATTLLLGCLLICQSAQADASLPKAFPKILVVKKGFISPSDPAVLAFAKQFKFVSVTEVETNPICCVWLQPLSVDKRMTGDQFLMVHYGYTVIQVTDAKGLDLLRTSLLEKGYGTNGLFPAGVMTSFPLVP